MNPYETGISVLTATPGTAQDTRGRRDAVDPGEEQQPWWRRALRSLAGRKVMAELDIAATAEGSLPAEWEVHPLVGPDDCRGEAALPVTALALRAVLGVRAGVMFLEQRPLQHGPGSRGELHLCAIDPQGTRAALMPVC